MKNIELKVLKEEDFDILTKLHIEFCSPNSKISKQKYKDFVNEVNRISSEGYEVGIFGEYVETYKELKEWMNIDIEDSETQEKENKNG